MPGLFDPIRRPAPTPDPVPIDDPASGPRALFLEVRLLEHRWHGDSWPPAPGRLFQALVAGAYGGRWATEESAEDRAAKDKALNWLESRLPPLIAAPAGRAGRTVLYYVPNNSLDRKGGDPARISEIRTAKDVSPRLFEAPPTLFYAWHFSAEGEAEAMAARICLLAERLHTLGRGIDPAFARGEVVDWAVAEARLEGSGMAVHRPSAGRGGMGGTEMVCPIPGTLDSLHQRHAAGRRQYQPVRKGRSEVIDFTRPPKPLLAPVAYERHPVRLLCELCNDEGSLVAWPLTRTAPLVERVRDRLAALLVQRLPGRERMIERLLIGRGAEAADKPLRPRLIPLPSIGVRHTDPSIRRILLEVPPDCPLPAAELTRSLSGLDLTMNPETGEVLFEEGLLLRAAEQSGMARLYHVTLDKTGGQEPTDVWHTITPALLPAARHRGRRQGRITGSARQEEEAAAAQAVRQALRHAGIDPTDALIQVQREPWTAKGARAGDFTLPTRLEGRPRTPHDLWHVAIRLAKPVAGPLLIGDGRWLGLGLMQPSKPLRTIQAAGAGGTPLPTGKSVDHRIDADTPAGLSQLPPGADFLAFPIRPGCRPPVDAAAAVVEALRRALMSRARQRDGSLPLLFSGHQVGPGPAKPGHHAHVFLAVEDADGDGLLDRVLVIAPWRADRSWAPARKDRTLFHRIAAPLARITAGPLGILALDAAEAPAPERGRVWSSRTPYSPTRHPKGGEPAPALIADVTMECRRRGLPAPVGVSIDGMERGPRNGLSAHLTLHFAVEVDGPLLLGRTAHSGGGWFGVDG